MPSTEKLVKQAQKGDHAAFAELIRRYERAVTVTAWPILNDFHAAQDVAQDSFVIAYQKLNQLREPASFGTWIFHIVRREASRAKSKNVKHGFQLNSDENISDSRGITDGRHDEIVRLLATLPDHERVVVVMKYLDGHSVQSIADTLNRPLGTVTKQLSRAIQRLRNFEIEVEK